MSKTPERREGTCCWSNRFNGKFSKLHCSYWRLKLLQASYVAMSGLEGILILLLLIDSPIQCDFTPFYQTTVVPVQIVTAMLVQIGSGLITDITAHSHEPPLICTKPSFNSFLFANLNLFHVTLSNLQKYAHRVLAIVSFTSLIIDPFFFFKAVISPYAVLVLFVIRFGLIVQVGNSTGKLIKMRLDKLNMSEENQVHVFNNTTIAGDVVGRLSSILGYAIASLLIHLTPNIGFERIKIIFFAITFFWDCATLALSLLVEQDYFAYNEEDDEPTLQQLFYEEQKNPKRGKIKRNFFEDDEGKRITYQEINNNEEASRRGTYTRRQTLEYFDPPNGTEPPDGSHPPSQNMTLQRGATRPTEQKRGTENSPMRNLRVETLRSAHMPDDPPPSLNATLQRGIVRSPQLLVDSSTDSPEDDIEVLPPKKSISTSSGSSSEEDESDKAPTGCLQCRSVCLFFKNTLLWTTTLHLLLNILMIEFITIVLRFSVPRAPNKGPVTREDFCNGLFTSLVELQAVSDGVRLLGSFFYQTVIAQSKPYTFYSVFFMIMILLSMLLFGLTYFSLPSIVSNAVLSYLNVASYLIASYDNTIICAVVSPEIVGFSFAVQGAGIQLFALIPVALSVLIDKVGLPDWSVTTILMAYIFIVLVQGYFHVKFQKKALIKLESPSDVEDGFLQKVFNKLLGEGETDQETMGQELLLN